MGVPIGTGPSGPVWHPQNNVVSNPPPPPTALAEHIAQMNNTATQYGIGQAQAPVGMDPQAATLAAWRQQTSPYPLLNMMRMLHVRKRYDLDPVAVLANALGEGGWGTPGADAGSIYPVGDQGTSFGPFQLHEGGALPEGRDRAWAETRPGIKYALRQMSGVAGGLVGPEAVRQIVTQFERPAGAAQRAEERIGYLDKARQGWASAGGGMPPKPIRGLEELLYKNRLWDAQGGFYNDADLSAAHDTHVHIADDKAKAMLRAIRIAQNMGLTVGSNPYTTGHPETSGHTDNSWHYKMFPGTYGPDNQQLGMAADITGDPSQLEAYYNTIYSRGIAGSGSPGAFTSTGTTGGGSPAAGSAGVPGGNGGSGGASTAPALLASDFAAPGRPRSRKGRPSSDLIAQLLAQLQQQQLGARV